MPRGPSVGGITRFLNFSRSGAGAMTKNRTDSLSQGRLGRTRTGRRDDDPDGERHQRHPEELVPERPLRPEVEPRLLLPRGVEGHVPHPKEPTPLLCHGVVLPLVQHLEEPPRDSRF